MKLILNLDDLKKVSGGSNENVGMHCPRCGCFISITMQQFIQSGTLVCPECDLKLTIDKLK